MFSILVYLGDDRWTEVLTSDDEARLREAFEKMKGESGLSVQLVRRMAMTEGTEPGSLGRAVLGIRKVIEALLPPSRERSIAITEIETAGLWTERAEKVLSAERMARMEAFSNAEYVGLDSPSAVPTCRVPPAGWACSREAGHDGPCASTKLPEVGNVSSREADDVVRVG